MWYFVLLTGYLPSRGKMTPPWERAIVSYTIHMQWEIITKHFFFEFESSDQCQWVWVVISCRRLLTVIQYDISEIPNSSFISHLAGRRKLEELLHSRSKERQQSHQISWIFIHKACYVLSSKGKQPQEFPRTMQRRILPCSRSKGDEKYRPFQNSSE